MLRFNVKRVLTAKGVTHLSKHLREMGFNRHKVAQMRSNERKHITVADLGKLCYKLRCTPNDLFQWLSNDKQPLDPTHPLHDILCTGHDLELVTTISTLTMDQIKEVNRYARQLQN